MIDLSMSLRNLNNKKNKSFEKKPHFLSPKTLENANSFLFAFMVEPKIFQVFPDFYRSLFHLKPQNRYKLTYKVVSPLYRKLRPRAKR